MFEEETDGPDRSRGPQDRLAERMRAVKETSGLSYGGLAHRTHYSRSSWERFLNGKQMPSRAAVTEFATAAGEDPGPLLALLDAAVAEERATPAPAPRPVPAAAPVRATAPAPASATAPVTASVTAPGAAAPGPVRRRLAGWLPAARALGYVSLGAALGSVVSVLLVAPGAGRTTGAAGPLAGTPAPSPTGSVVPASGKIEVGCESDTCLRREPQAMDCHWDATTVRDTWLRGMQIQLRYSAACQAVWGRIEGGAVGDTVIIKDKGGNEQSATIRLEHDTYTRMLAVSPQRPWQDVTVCGRIPKHHEQECSPDTPVQP